MYEVPLLALETRGPAAEIPSAYHPLNTRFFSEFSQRAVGDRFVFFKAAFRPLDPSQRVSKNEDLYLLVDLSGDHWTDLDFFGAQVSIDGHGTPPRCLTIRAIQTHPRAAKRCLMV